ncbi:MAG: TonB-dependent receptor [Sediminibacterium sp. Gen4]|jgi:Fe(3+) dicitrate transport protein|uniref:TonB-dependent receptor family protein n=1 Tax=unclassified Sediminibacterium TaxID=2635961 RepID=UPI0015BA15F3|nr:MULTISPECIES: TonB-dependent receptor [unclassified Sediminibacterium]MBW0162320.1 TonB-dependent receptor [Sediminibacterium sp.]MBW0164188.1 TonB-dependent receptor [Sediminibacterium sp.]NWK65520.1 TonB-dependent receptor [Sediminibacterium sp. Gen4]
MSKRALVLCLMIWVLNVAIGQTKKGNSDTLLIKSLPDVTVVGRNSKSDYQQMPEIVGTNIYAGKKNTLIVLDNVQGNVVTNNMRQVLAKVPGIHIWESDPSGIQIGIAARGLSPNRSWEFNVRQNGYDIAADPFGYPEAYYNPQLQAVQRIEIVRGHGSLQYGPQFGGLVNYILRNGSEVNKSFEFETQQTIGSNGLFNSYNAIGGKKGKVHYYTFFDHRNGDGWRENSRYFTNAGYGTVTYNFTTKFSLTAEVMRSHIRSQQPGGLTDEQIKQDAQQSFRSRNWFDITWTTPALIANFQINENTRWNTKLFGTIGDRNSVGFLQSITTKDSINPATLSYNNRVVNLDQYRNYGLESRIITDYRLGKMKNTLSAGIRLYTGTTTRQADGKGTTGTGYDVTITGNYPRDIIFKSRNTAAFAENIFRISDKFLIIPGIRYEWLEGSSSGRNGYTSGGTEIILQNITRDRSFILAGVGTEYHVTRSTEVYANFSQAYRPIQFANLQAPPTTDVVDADLKDAKGYNIDLGYRGKVKDFLQFDISGFYLQYDNRVGTITVSGTPSYRLITNVGSSTSKGFEGYVEFNPFRAFGKNKDADLIIFGSYGYTDAKYSGNHKDASTKGKKVENAPTNIFRGGITGGYKGFLLTVQMSNVGETFSDANNTVTPSANGNNGLIPSYTVTDLTATYKFSKGLNLKAGTNNLFNERYFTRRAGGYPGPGALPADGRTFFISVGAKF